MAIRRVNASASRLKAAISAAFQLFVLAFCCACADGAQITAEAPGEQIEVLKVEVGQDVRNYLLYVPADLQPGAPRGSTNDVLQQTVRHVLQHH